jgi:pimeloyl-ACP methyl ester carboxylesterase
MGQWSNIEIGGKKADVFEPARPAAQKAAVLFLHGHGMITLSGNEIYSAELERRGLRCICPHGKRSWWGDRLCAEFDPQITPAAWLRNEVVPWMTAHWDAGPGQIALLGVSMGGQGALKLAYRHPQEFPIVAALAPAIDFHNWHGRGLPLDEIYETAESARQDTVTLLLHPLNWPRHQFILCDPDDIDWYEGIERLASKLTSTGIPFESDLTTRAGGHTWQYFNSVAPRVMQFVEEKLKQESKNKNEK